MPGGTPPPPYPSADPYTVAPGYGYAPPQKNKSPFWVYIAIGAAVLLLICAGSAFVALKAVGNNGKGSVLGGNNAGGNFASSQSLNNLTIVYASDQMNFTSIQQADKFSDDTFTSFSEHPNYVRINFKEQQTASNSSYFSYDQSFRLILPDQTIVAGQNAESLSGPQQEEVRTNWVDFPTSAKVDLNNLVLRLGGQDEAQMDVPLKSGSNLSKYQPEVTNPNTPFKYAQLDWTLVHVTKSLSFAGQQAKTGQVYITVALRADNHSNYRVWLFGSFVHLKANGNNLSPTLDSYTNAFDDMEPGTTNHQGTQTFLTQPSSDGKYTLDFLPDKNGDWPEQTVNFQIS